ncbi:MAG TPA: complex I NDUFA9 subunit family protein [Candidatus Nitrosotalea sp.]|nr:complex I NDUFA9 subunit family protein [Solirubrobacteraceae bacterium]HUM18364.1 complex I NDUFA9 subunit family protein [Candidatus Nitrosotalea sp.]
MAQRVFVTGGTGFVGKSVVRALLAQGFLVRLLVRPGSEQDLKGFESIDRVPGDVMKPEGLAPSVEGCSALVHLVGIIREQRSRGVTFDRLHAQASRNMVALARAAGIKRYVHMSALGTRPEAPARYHRTKWDGEEAVRASELDWTIFRPSIIFGRGDAFVSVLARMIKRSPVVPVLGSGRYRLQPIAVEQVAEGFARAVRVPACVGQTYDVAGPTPYTFVDLLDEIGHALGRARVLKIHVPLGPVKVMTYALDWLPFYPVSSDQLTMLEEESVGDPSRFFADLGVKPEPLPAGLQRMLVPS